MPGIGPEQQTVPLSDSANKQSGQLVDETTSQLVEAKLYSVLNLNDDQCSSISLENIQNLTNENFINEDLEEDTDDDVNRDFADVTRTIANMKDEQEEKQLRYIEKRIVTYLGCILDELHNTNTRLTALEEGFAYLYERQSKETVIKLLNDAYLVDIRELDTRILSSFESDTMYSFFRAVAFYMKHDYSSRWQPIKQWLRISLQPKTIQYNLLGFGNLKKVNKNAELKIIRSPMKLNVDVQCPNRSSYATFENSFGNHNKNLIAVFEATTSKLYFGDDILREISTQNNKYTNAMKKIIRKLCQLERQVYYLSCYYSIPLNQFFAGLVLFELYRDPSINPHELLKKIMSSEIIRGFVPLLFRLYKIDQFLIIY